MRPAVDCLGGESLRGQTSTTNDVLKTSALGTSVLSLLTEPGEVIGNVPGNKKKLTTGGNYDQTT